MIDTKGGGGKETMRFSIHSTETFNKSFFIEL